MTHFIHYIKRVIADKSRQSKADLPYLEDQPIDQGFERPIYHSIPKNSGASSKIKIGDTIWLLSQLRSPWRVLSPALEAKIVVSGISTIKEEKSERLKFEADNSSQWFPIFDASQLIANLYTKSHSGEVKTVLSDTAKTVGQALRFIREIENPKLIVAYCNFINLIPIDFISYRMVDGTQSAFELAEKLVHSHSAVFWDRWSLPRRLSERGEQLEHYALDTHIQLQIKASRAVWGVRSPKYAEIKSYSLLEKKLAVTLRKLTMYPPSNDD